MAANVGLSTPRGSGTSGYVQRNLAHLRPRDQIKPYPDNEALRHKQRQPDKGILEHDRKREIEVKVFELRDRLEDEGVEEEEIETQTEALRRKLTKESERGNGRGGTGGGGGKGRNLKMHQVHELAEAKIKQDERFRGALGIRRDYEEGGHWRRQEEKGRERAEKAEKEAKEDQGRRERDD